MADVTLSKAVRSNLLHLQNTAKMMDITQERLATGKKVNSALDNPTNFFTSEALNARAADIGTLLDAMSNGIQTIEAADNGLTAITKTIESMQSTLRQARQDKSFQVSTFALSPTATGELTFSNGALDDPISVPLTNAVPASITSGADYALEGSQGRAAFAYGGALTFDDDTDTVTFRLEVDGVERDVTIDRELVNTITGDDEIADIDEMESVMQAAIEAAGFEADQFEISNDGTDITVGSTSRGPDSTVSFSNQLGTDGGTGGANDMGAANISIDGAAADDVSAESTTFDINYGGASVSITLGGDSHPTIEDAVAHIQSEIDAYNTANPSDPIDVTVSAEDGRLKLRGPVDGTGPEITLTATAPDTPDTVFGTAIQREEIAPSEADGAPKSVDEMVAAINGNPDLRAAVRASNDNGKLRIENLSTGELNIEGIAGGFATGATGEDNTAEIGGNNVRANLAKQFNALRSELDRLAEDASYNGVNLLRGDQLKIVFNELGTSMIEIQTKDAEGNTRPINSNELGVLEISEEDLDADADIDTLLNNLQVALGEVRAQASDLGSTLSVVQNRENFTKEMINTLESGAANLTLADTNEEGANMLALQTRQQLSQTALSLASQADQAVLRLFG